MMTDLDICRQAILHEEEGAAFYSLAAEKASAEEVREAFLFLKDEELKHASWIRSLYERLVLENASTNLEWETLAEIDFNRQAELNKMGKSPKIFLKNKESFQFTINDIAVFAAGSLIEKASIEFYQNALVKAAFDESKKLYQRLIDWEKDHLYQLQSIHETLSKEWLDQQEFTHSPKL